MNKRVSAFIMPVWRLAGSGKVQGNPADLSTFRSEYTKSASLGRPRVLKMPKLAQPAPFAGRCQNPKKVTSEH